MASTYFVKHDISIKSYLDSDEKLIALQRTEQTAIRSIREEVVGHNETRVVDKATADESLAFGGVATANFLYIETDQEITVKLNGGSEVFKIAPTTGYKAKLLWDGEFTSISVSNDSADTDAIVTYMIAGV